MEKELNTVESFDEKLALVMAELGLTLWGVTDGEEIRKYQAYYDERPGNTVSAFESGDMGSRCLLEGRFLSIAFPYAHELSWDPPAHFSVYARGQDYHRVVQGFLERIIQRIEEMGFSARGYTDSNELPERLIASLAGLGYLGRNSTLITQEYGSYVFLGEIWTDLPLTINRDYVRPGDHTPCGACRRCLSACPVSILGSKYVETEQCLSAVTQKKELTKDEMNAMKGRLFGCDTCQIVCPHNQGKENRGLKQLAPLSFMVRPDLNELLTMTAKEFKETFKISAAGWRGRTVLIRNAMIALKDRDLLPEGLSFGSPLLQKSYGMLKDPTVEQAGEHLIQEIDPLSAGLSSCTNEPTDCLENEKQQNQKIGKD